MATNLAEKRMLFEPEESSFIKPLELMNLPEEDIERELNSMTLDELREMLAAVQKIGSKDLRKGYLEGVLQDKIESLQ